MGNYEYKTDFEKLLSSLNHEPNPNELVSKNSSQTTKELFSYLKDIYGKKILSGQQYLQKDEVEDWIYYQHTGKLPAIKGYDFMGSGFRKRGKNQDEQVLRAIEWATKCGGIVTMCWHWYAPDDMTDYTKGSSFYYKTTTYNEKTSFDIIRAVEYGTPEYQFIISEIDAISKQLKLMSDFDIPVLWRPLHEASGSWFWWGKRQGADEKASIEAYKKLWYIIFDRMENYHKLTNLIWVWNGQDKAMEVNPNTFDIVGEDFYSEFPRDHSSQIEKYNQAVSYSSGKMVTLSECGYIPSPDELVKDKVKWLWYLPWWGKFVYKMNRNCTPILDDSKNAQCNPDYLDPEFLQNLFNSDYVVTLQDLPHWNKDKYTLPSSLKKKFKL